MSRLEDYISTFSSRCSDFSYLASPEFLLIASRIEAVILLPISLFGILCILCKTPKYMSGFKWSLLNLHVWFLMLTVFSTLLTTPYYFYPAQVRCSLGFFESWSIPPQYQAYLFQMVYGGIVSAVILLFENRHSHLVPPTENVYRINGPLRVLLGVVNFCLGSCNALSAWSNDYSSVRQESLKLSYLTTVPCPHPLYFTPSSYASEKFSTGVEAIIFVAVITVFSQLSFLIIHSFAYIRRSRGMDSFSERTKRIQKAFFHAALAQIAAPLCVMIIPVIFLSYILITKKYLPELINLCVLSTPIHCVFSTAALLYFNSPYRNFVRQLLGASPNTVAVVPKVSSV